MEVWFLLVLWTKPGACAYEASTLPLNYTPKHFFFSWQGLLRLPRMTLNLRSSCVSLSIWDYSPVLAGPVALSLMGFINCLSPEHQTPFKGNIT